jgi:hypothetical protein
MINPTLNLEPNTFQMLYFNLNNIVVDTTIFSDSASEDHILEILNIRKQWYPEIEFSLRSSECGVGGIGQELYLGRIRDIKPFNEAIFDEDLWRWVPNISKPEDIEGHYWAFMPETLQWSLIELPNIDK